MPNCVAKQHAGLLAFLWWPSCLWAVLSSQTSSRGQQDPLLFSLDLAVLLCLGVW